MTADREKGSMILGLFDGSVDRNEAQGGHYMSVFCLGSGWFPLLGESLIAHKITIHVNLSKPFPNITTLSRIVLCGIFF